MSAPFALRGRVFALTGDPFALGADADGGPAVRFEEDGAVVVADGLIRAVGPAEATLAAHPDVPTTRFANDVLAAGFIDAHVHYPQTGVIASYGAQLLDWLNRYTFPEEIRFADPEVAAATAELFLDLLAANGTTSACAYCATFPASVDALFAAAEARGVRIAAGKMMMDRNAPAALLDDAQSGYDDSLALLDRWHGRGRARYAISPRFAPTSSAAQLEAAGALWRARPSALMQTHLAENVNEVAWVAELHPDAPDYLGVYQAAGLVGPGANFGHAIHLSARERALLAESGAGISHCPTSNLFIGSGLFDLHGLRAEAPAAPIGLATDVGGGSSFSMFSAMRAAYEIAQLRGRSLHPVQAFHLATLGAAETLRVADRVGALRPGMEADLVLLDPAATPALAQRAGRAESLADLLFALMILGDDRVIRRAYAAGRLIKDRDL